MSSFILGLFGVPQERKSAITVERRSEQYIEDRLNNEDISGYTSVFYACGRVIADGLAKPPVYVQQVTKGGRRFATEHPLYGIISAVPNKLQTSQELRQVQGWQAATTGNSYCWINRAKRSREILEIVPLNPSEISRVDQVEIGALPKFIMNGSEMAADEIWHFRGHSNERNGGVDTASMARRAILMAQIAESFGIDLFKNRAALEGIISPDGQLDQEGFKRLKESFADQHTSNGKKGRTAFFPTAIKYQQLSATATDSQWLEMRRFQIEEICRYFRVSPIKVFSALGSQSYASVEQGHIAHDADTDAHWHDRYEQSATKALLTPKDRREGYTIVLDNRAALRGTAKERAEYYNLGVTGGWLTVNEVREAENFDRSNDPEHDKLRPAANLFGGTSKPSGTPSN
ncbi:phage portal protein [uncultured Sphingomonas sp.]|uniref:phage portal protein n=1 Tax=uncultured Sphingomonas sp. TaxID=158754 RepID=UPI0025FEC344|nr:phage portal protein [uncultured Sphingomonas sp.]